MSQVGYTIETHVPQRGEWLAGYTLTSMSLAVEYIPPGPFPLAIEGATVRLRFIGEVVPEPATWLLTCLALCGVVHLKTHRRADSSAGR